MNKKYNSITAKMLAKKHKLKLIDIKSHRSDNKITIKDVKNKINKINNFFKLDYVYKHFIQIDNSTLNKELKIKIINKIFNKLKYKTYIKDPKLYTNNNEIMFKYNISNDDILIIDDIQENITEIFNKEYELYNNKFKIMITAAEFKKLHLDESDLEFVDFNEKTAEQGKAYIKTKKSKDKSWIEYDLHNFGNLIK